MRRKFGPFDYVDSTGVIRVDHTLEHSGGDIEPTGRGYAVEINDAVVDDGSGVAKQSGYGADDGGCCAPLVGDGVVYLDIAHIVIDRAVPPADEIDISILKNGGDGVINFDGDESVLDVLVVDGIVFEESLFGGFTPLFYGVPADEKNSVVVGRECACGDFGKAIECGRVGDLRPRVVAGNGDFIGGGGDEESTDGVGDSHEGINRGRAVGISGRGDGIVGD